MFDKGMIDALWAELQGKYGNEPDWERIVRDTHLGVARSDAGLDLQSIDPRVAEAIEQHRG